MLTEPPVQKLFLKGRNRKLPADLTPLVTLLAADLHFDLKLFQDLAVLSRVLL